MPQNFGQFTAGTPSSSTQYLVGYNTAVSGGERRFPITLGSDASTIVARDSGGSVNVKGVRIDNGSGDTSIEMGGTGNVYIDLKNPYSDDFDLRLITSTTNKPTIQTGTNQHLYINPGSNLGVGIDFNSSPGKKLDVAGNGRFTANAQTLDLVGTDHSYIGWYPDGVTAGRKGYTGYPDSTANYFTIANEINDGTGHIVLLPGTSANVGIGTSSPTSKLDVAGTITGNYLILNSTDSVNEGGELSLKGAGTYGAFQLDYYQGNARIHTLASGKTFQVLGGGIYVNGTANSYIAGRLGIGTTQPVAKLEVSSEIRVTGTRANTWMANTLYFGDPENDSRYFMGTRGTNESASANFRFYYYSNLNNVDNWSTVLGALPTSLNSNTYSLTLKDNAIFVDSNNNVGIGTTSLVDKLTVNGPIYIGGGTSNYQNSAVDAGNLTNTYLALGPAGSANDWAYIRQIGGSNNYHLSIDLHDDGDATQSGQSFSIRNIASAAGNPDPTPSTRFHINNIGNVGIGTDGPGYRLDVNGDTITSGWFRTRGDCGWYSQTYGGGWWMTDTSWIRSYNSKNVWTGSGLLGSDGGLTIGYGGVSSPSGGAIIKGNVGINLNNNNNTVTVPAPLTVGHNSASTYGTVVSLQETATGNSDGPKLNFVKNTPSKSWSVGIGDGSTNSKFGIFENAGTGGFGTERFTVNAGGDISIPGNLTVYSSCIADGTTGVIGASTTGGSRLEQKSLGDGRVGFDGANNAAYMTFHRPYAYAVKFGLDTDNKLKVGGWSMDTNAYEIWHDGNASGKVIPAKGAIVYQTIAGTVTVSNAYHDRVITANTAAGAEVVISLPATGINNGTFVTVIRMGDGAVRFDGTAIFAAPDSTFKKLAFKNSIAGAIYVNGAGWYLTGDLLP